MARPVGWWIKAADSALEAAFESAFQNAGTTRREWQTLSTLSGGPITRSALDHSLESFADSAEMAAIVDHLRMRDDVVGSGEREDPLRLTPAGTLRFDALGARVAEVRRLVSDALPPADYARLVELLAKLVEAVRPAPADGDVRQAPPPSRS